MQGFNMGRYVPPEQEGVLSANQVSQKPSRKQRAGAPVVRFEMPFAVWCSSCRPRETLIPQGVRFNAEKRRVGAYLSTPIFAFRMKHTTCQGTLEIRTDPRNAAYVVTEGGRKKDVGDDRPTEGTALVDALSETERERIRNDAFAALEVKVADKRAAKADEQRVEELLARSDRDWDDPYALNQRMRKAFRAGRKEREAHAAADGALQDRMSLAFDIAPETADDRRRAADVEFGIDRADDQAALGKVRARGLFADAPSATGKASVKDDLRRTLSGNTRAVVDPFLNQSTTRPKPLPGVKRKRKDSPEALSIEMVTERAVKAPEAAASTEVASTDTITKPKIALVNDDYGSD